MSRNVFCFQCGSTELTKTKTGFICPSGHSWSRGWQKAPDLTGQRFDRLVIERQAPTVTEARWVARCDCGKLVLIAGPELRRKARNGKPNACPDCLKALRKERKRACLSG